MKNWQKFIIGKCDVEEISEAQSRTAMKAAILSACFGSLPQILLGHSSIVILYAAKLNAGAFISMCTTSLQYLSTCLLMIPIAYIMQRTGIKKILVPAVIISMFAFLLAASACWFSGYSHIVLLLGLSLFAIMVAVYTAGWFPLLNDIIPENERGRFFGKMRVSWQTLSLAFIIISTFFVGKDAPAYVLQIILAIAGISIFGRIYFLRKIPEKKTEPVHTPFLESITQVLQHTPLVGFGVYCFWLYLFAGATIPVIIVFCKYHLVLQDNLLVFLSFFMMTGAIIGFYCGGKLVDVYGTKLIFLCSHFSFGILNLLMLLVHNKSIFSILLIFMVVVVYGTITAAASVAISSEMLSIVPQKDNRNIAIALCFGLYFAGMGISRFAAGWILNSGMLANSWSILKWNFTQYHTLFFFYGIGVTSTFVLLTLVQSIVKKPGYVPVN